MPNVEKANHLLKEKSPYLQQHAYNPVDWYPWAEEALERSRQEDKPIFLSIGYSTCHWCHVMDRESFQDEEIAKILNEHFIPIKVDREERPDLDAVYMMICHFMTKNSGWPLNLVLTPELKPFFAGTYIPKKGQGRSIGLIQLLEAMVQQWGNNREKLYASARAITDKVFFNKNLMSPPTNPNKGLALMSKGMMRQYFDKTWGGFGEAPKFPCFQNPMFLLRHSIFEKDPQAVEMVEKTLQHMYRGGIHDHIGGGLYRYSTDVKWLIPHFEKILIDNALSVTALLETYQITGKDMYRRLAVKTIDYLLRELYDESTGGFYSGQDADVEGVEGAYYVFSPEEIQSALGAEDGKEFCDAFDIHTEGNYGKKSIPNLIENQEFETYFVSIGRTINSPLPENASPEEARLIQMLRRVYDYRQKRYDLHKDTKILTAGNGLTMVAFAKAYQILGDEEYLKIAEKNQRFLETHLSCGSGAMKVRYADGESIGTGYLDCHAYYAYGLLELYTSTFDVKYLEKAEETAKQLVDRFYDPEQGGFYLNASDGEELIYRMKDMYDKSQPSGNSVATYVIKQLYHITNKQPWKDVCEKQLPLLSGNIPLFVTGFNFAQIPMLYTVYPEKELICVLRDNSQMDSIRKLIKEKPLLNTALVVMTQENRRDLIKVAPHLSIYQIPDTGEAVYYLCKNKTCQQPQTDINKIMELI